jgi:hypothetical protein
LAGLLFLWQVSTELCATGRVRGSAADTVSLRGFGVLLVCMMLGGVVYRGATVTLPALFEINGAGIFAAVTSLFNDFPVSSNVVATAITSGLYLVGMLGQYAGGWAGERYDLRLSYLVFHLVTIVPAFLMGMATDVPLVLLATLHGFFLLGMQPVENTLVARLTPPSLRSSAYGMKFVLTFGVGALAVKLIKEVELHWGLDAVFPSLGIVSLALVAAIGVLIAFTPKMRS